MKKYIKKYSGDIMSTEFLMKLRFLYELMNKPSDYSKYNEDVCLSNLNLLNKTVKENVGLFCLDENALENYKKIVSELSKCYGKEILIARTYILDIENMGKSSKQGEIFKKNILAMHNIKEEKDYNFIKKIITFDFEVIPFILYNPHFYDEKFNDAKLLKYALNYFQNMNELDYKKANKVKEFCLSKGTLIGR